LNHARAPVTLNKLQQPRGKGRFNKDPMLVLHPATARKQHYLLLKKLKEAEKISEKSSFNEILEIGKTSTAGIVTSGVSYNYVRDVVKELKLNVRILKLGMTHPLPRVMCEEFIKSCKEVIIVEELEPFLENQIKIIAHDIRAKVKIYGKTTGNFSRLYEYNPDIINKVISNVFKLKNQPKKPIESKIKLPNRSPIQCPGCSHRATYYAIKKVSPSTTIYPSDIGCYGIGLAPSLEMTDVLLCMGANAGTALGFAISTKQKVISFMGDSTFFHAGIPAIIDAVHHNHDCVFTIFDNRTTAMTGHQPHPGSAYDGMGREAKNIKIGDLIKGLGIKHIETVNPYNLKETSFAFKRALDFKGPSVVVSKASCILLENKEKINAGVKIPKYKVNHNKCQNCKICIIEFGCTAFYYDKNSKLNIDEELCNGCGICLQICPFDAIYKTGENNK
jgi:indolepyruvate ferredoxin oxidoreductase alpha subunit